MNGGDSLQIVACILVFAVLEGARRESVPVGAAAVVVA